MHAATPDDGASDAEQRNAIVVALTAIKAIVEGRPDEARTMLAGQGLAVVGVLAGLAAAYAVRAAAGSTPDAAARLEAARQRVLEAVARDAADPMTLIEGLPDD